MSQRSHTDQFVIANPPLLNEWPQFLLDRLELNFVELLNSIVELLDCAITEGRGQHTESGTLQRFRLKPEAQV